MEINYQQQMDIIFLILYGITMRCTQLFVKDLMKVAFIVHWLLVTPLLLSLCSNWKCKSSFTS